MIAARRLTIVAAFAAALAAGATACASHKPPEKEPGVVASGMLRATIDSAGTLRLSDRAEPVLPGNGVPHPGKQKDGFTFGILSLEISPEPVAIAAAKSWAPQFGAAGWIVSAHVTANRTAALRPHLPNRPPQRATVTDAGTVKLGDRTAPVDQIATLLDGGACHAGDQVELVGRAGVLDAAGAFARLGCDVLVIAQRNFR